MSAYAAVLGFVPYVFGVIAVLLVGLLCIWVRWIK